MTLSTKSCLWMLLFALPGYATAAGQSEAGDHHTRAQAPPLAEPPRGSSPPQQSRGTPSDGAGNQNRLPTDSATPAQSLRGGDAIVVTGEGAVARCCPRDAGPEECQNFLGAEVALGEEVQCGGWRPEG